MFRNDRQRGFTLIEVMIVVALVGILAAVAYPSYMGSIRKARRTDAENGLTQAVQRMELQFARNTTYVGATIPAQSPEGYYTLTLTPPGALPPGVTNYTIRATPNVLRNADPLLNDPVNQQLDFVSWFQVDSTGLKQHQRQDGTIHNNWKSP